MGRAAMTGLREHIQRFACTERGAVAVDWVTVTAGLLLLGLAVVYAVFNAGVSPLTREIVTALESAAKEDPFGWGNSKEDVPARGNAAPIACLRTGNRTVCFGPK